MKYSVVGRRKRISLLNKRLFTCVLAAFLLVGLSGAVFAFGAGQLTFTSTVGIDPDKYGLVALGLELPEPAVPNLPPVYCECEPDCPYCTGCPDTCPCLAEEDLYAKEEDEEEYEEYEEYEEDDRDDDSDPDTNDDDEDTDGEEYLYEPGDDGDGETGPEQEPDEDIDADDQEMYPTPDPYPTHVDPKPTPEPAPEPEPDFTPEPGTTPETAPGSESDNQPE